MNIKQRISDHPVLGFSREIEVTNITFNLIDELIIIYFNCTHSDSNENVVEFKDVGQPEYWVVDNSYQVVIRDEQMNPVVNPDYGRTESRTIPIYNEQGEEIGTEEVDVVIDNEEFLKAPAFKVFMGMVEGYKEIVQKYILHDDTAGRFDYRKPVVDNTIEDEEVI